MTTYNNSYLKSTDYDILAGIAAGFINTLGPAQGTAEYSYTDDEGTEITVPVVGDPTYWYLCLRNPIGTTIAVDIPEGAETCTADEALPVLGVWAGDEL